MLRLGITGGIASGKSVVARMLRDLGFQVIDADTLSHQLMEPGQPAFDDIVAEFGADVLGASSRIDRAKLAAIVFADPAKLARLNAILHPRIEQQIARRFDAWEKEGVADAAFVEAALLVEAGYQKRLHGLLVAWCTPEQQLQRLLARGLAEDEARGRMAAQMPVEQKLHYATEKIDCSGTLEETHRQVTKLAAKLRKSPAPE
jgi:dephospho-CoA kinase